MRIILLVFLILFNSVICSQDLVLKLSGHNSSVYSVTFSPDGNILASGSLDKNIKLWNVADGRLIHTLSGHKSSILSLAFSPDGKILASASFDNTIKLWSLSNGSLIRTLSGHNAKVNSVCFSPDGNTIASGSDDYSIKLWNVNNGSLIRTLLSGNIQSVSFSPDGNIIASGSEDQTIILWRVSDGSRIQTLSGHNKNVESVSFSPDGNIIASGSADQTIKLWRVVDGSLIRTLFGHSSDVTTISFSPDGNILASGSADQTVQLWRVSDGNLIQTLAGYKFTIFSVSFSPDGNLLAIGSWDDAIKLWNISNLKINPLLSNDFSKPENTRSEIDIRKEIPKSSISNPEAVAVIIGNENYLKKDIPPVDYAIEDASIMKQYLMNSLGYREGNIIYIENAALGDMNSIFGNSNNFKGKLHSYVKEGKSDVFIYYSGHGAPDPESKQGYFVPVDCDPSLVSLNGYSLNTFYENLSKINYKTLTVVIDACFSGASDKGSLLKNVSPVFITVENPVISKENTIVFTSADGDQVSSWYPEKKHSLFTYYFLKGLKGEANLDNDDKLTVGEMEEYISDNVPYMARRLNNREQNPQVFGVDKNKVLINY